MTGEKKVITKKDEKGNNNTMVSVEKEMATHYTILAWRISWTEEPGGLQSMGSQELGMT